MILTRRSEYRTLLFLCIALTQLCVSRVYGTVSKEKKGREGVTVISKSRPEKTPDTAKYYRDLYPDTWVGTDALGRTMPDYEKVGPVKKDKRRVVSIFYITWHTEGAYKSASVPFLADVTKVLHQDPNARMDARNPFWKDASFHWGEPEMGYFLSQDEYVIRRDMSMLSDAGVDLLVMDLTNAVRY
ncbi:MAG: hypothetical protein Q8908_02190 [Bacteroidota bacterium]|nr:hypothetical protein [Bacteroidota bacterium]